MLYIENLVEYLLVGINNIVNNEALAIFFVSIIFKLALFPFSISQIKFVNKNKKLQPKLEELKRKCGDNKEKYNMEMINFYKENDLNPLMGCLPALAQIPVMISIFGVLRSGHLFNNAYIFGLALNQPDPKLIFPVINSIFLIISSFQSMSSYDETSKYLPYFMVFMMFFFSRNWPLAVHLFMIYNSVFTLLQQMFIERVILKEK